MKTADTSCIYRLRESELNDKTLHEIEQIPANAQGGKFLIIAMTDRDGEAVGCTSPFNIDYPMCPTDCQALTEKTCEASPEFNGTRSLKWQEYLANIGYTGSN